jgi:hypothetical protein
LSFYFILAQKCFILWEECSSEGFAKEVLKKIFGRKKVEEKKDW